MLQDRVAASRYRPYRKLLIPRGGRGRAVIGSAAGLARVDLGANGDQDSVGGGIVLSLPRRPPDPLVYRARFSQSDWLAREQSELFLWMRCRNYEDYDLKHVRVHRVEPRTLVAACSGTQCGVYDSSHTAVSAIEWQASGRHTGTLTNWHALAGRAPRAAISGKALLGRAHSSREVRRAILAKNKISSPDA